MTDAPSPQYSSGSVDALRDGLDEARRDMKKLARELQQGLPKRNAAERLEAMSAAAGAALRGVAQRPLDLEVLCHDYAQRWHGEDWPLMDDDDKAELRMEAHRWLKCCSAVSWPTEPAQQPTIPVAREAAEPTQYLIDQFREHGTKPAAQEVPEPVAFQYRFQDDAGEWNGWFICDKHQYDRVTSNGKIGYCKAETRPLYTCSVPSTQSNTDAEPSRCKNTAARGESMETDALTGDAPVASVSALSMTSTTRVSPCDPNDPRPIWEQGLGSPSTEIK